MDGSEDPNKPDNPNRSDNQDKPEVDENDLCRWLVCLEELPHLSHGGWKFEDIASSMVVASRFCSSSALLHFPLDSVEKQVVVVSVNGRTMEASMVDLCLGFEQ
ncbi:hypothetical protein DEO72_LG8g2134 [Vigna unguiculata]|uniref:Uncharacterized protein n=1 Tax=Vigna unguiculata TaxID=3917 RepID=A0A4D6MU07_VIGUN|nr:hypothetical protein DEO72_LG8g2134 [Vigna unguiculata]